MQKTISYKTAISDFWNFENLEIFSTLFYFFKKNPPKFKNFQKKNGIYVLEETLNNVCTKFQVIPFINAVFTALWMWKMATFQGIWA